MQSGQPRRRSTRDIKRKKFDDELVESDWKPKKKSGSPTPEPPPVKSGKEASSPILFSAKTDKPLAAILPKKILAKRKSTTKKKKEAGGPSQSEAAVDVGRWQPQDDLALITAVLQSNDLQGVHECIKFTCKFKLEEINRRWYALLYDKAISKAAIESIRSLHPEDIVEIQSKTMFSDAEEAVLATLPSTTDPKPTLESMEELLNKNKEVFHAARNARVVLRHWQLMNQYKLLEDQTPLPSTSGPYRASFSDTEETLKEEASRGTTSAADLAVSAADVEMQVAKRRVHQELVRLEAEAPRWQVEVEHITGISPADFNSRTVAILRGRIVRYLMRGREITLGRSTKDCAVDVDVSLEGPASKVSRRQATIKMRSTGEFFVWNDGKRPIFVDGVPCLTGSKAKLHHNSILEISCLRFVFMINQELIGHVQDEVTNIMLVPQ